MLRLDHYELLEQGKMSPPAWHQHFRCTIPEQTRGPWAIERFEVDLGLGNLRLMREGRGCYPGTYTKLTCNGRTIMSDTTAEIDDHREPYQRATGRCLIHGLGLGCMLKAVLSKPNVTHVDVVEISSEVIDMVAPHFTTDPRVRVHHHDCRTMNWPRGSRWNMVWHDIWSDISRANLDEMKALHRKFRRRCDYQGSWSYDRLQDY